MNLSRLLTEYNAAKGPVRVGLIGAGKFGSMILAQAKHIKGYHVVCVADLDISKAKASFARVHWAAEAYDAPTLSEAYKTGKTCITDDAQALIEFDGIDCVIEATGQPIAGIRHALAAIEAAAGYGRTDAGPI